MNAKTLLTGLELNSKLPENIPDIQGLSENSKTVEKNFIFFARQGKKTTGLEYIEEAIQNGACLVISEVKCPSLRVPVLQVPSIHEAESALAFIFYQNPSKDLTIVGVTGTNGKTTFTYLMESIAKTYGLKVGVIGTVNYRIPLVDSPDQEILPAPNTTPNGLELQRILSLMKERKTDLVLMEVSSHALSLDRVRGIDFDGAVFTNLTQDHLDFHNAIEDYFKAKSKLFSGLRRQKKKNGIDKFCIINRDNVYGRKMFALSPIPPLTYGIQSQADISADELVLSSKDCRFTCILKGQKVPIQMKLVGRHNVSNALAAIAAAKSLKIPLSSIKKGLEKEFIIPGRLETIESGKKFMVFVDYAHTEDALKNVLEALREISKKRVLTLFGCGGDRDRIKRPLMGQTAANLSDWVVITSDNPRSEDPEKIALDIEVGIRRGGKTNYDVILDREKAIRKILKMAKKDDIVLIAGKGHETYQIFKDRTIHFDDREIARKYLCSK